MQGKILRFFQEGTIKSVGGENTLTLHTRVIAASNVGLKQAVQSGNSRENLFFRLNVLPIHHPPLRKRPEDIMLPAQHFLRTETEALKTGRISFTQPAMAALSAGDWPGNVRELQNCIRRRFQSAQVARLQPRIWDWVAACRTRQKISF